MRRVLVTGGMGFIGSNFVRYWRERHPADIVVNLDLLTYAGNMRNLADLEEGPHYRFVCGDIADADFVVKVMAEAQIDTVVHFAAESHVDRSIAAPQSFVRTNVLGSKCCWKQHSGRASPGLFKFPPTRCTVRLGRRGSLRRRRRLSPTVLTRQARRGRICLPARTSKQYGFPVIVTRCSNNYGPFQFPERLIPTLITRALRDEPLPVYGDGLNVRDWLHVHDHCSAVERVIEAGVPGEIYNVGGSNEKTNLKLVHRILQELGKPASLIEFVPDRLGHDRRYGIDSGKIRSQLGWNPACRFEHGIVQTVQWYVSHAGWWQSILNGTYRQTNQAGTGGHVE